MSRVAQRVAAVEMATTREQREMHSMFQRRSHHRRRSVRGVTTTGLLLGMTALIAVAAVAIDYALLVARKTEANAVAEATALAGAQVLWDRTVLPGPAARLDLPAAVGGESICEQQVRLAEENAEAIAAANHVADQPVAPASLTSYVFDINNTTCEPTPTTFYNGLKLTCEFKGVTLFLSNILGDSKADLTITREARLDQRVYGFRPTATLPVRMCPIIYMGNWSFTVDANGVAGLITITVGDDETSGADSGRLCTLIPTTSSSTGQAFADSQILDGLTVADLPEFGGQFALTDTGMVRNVKAASQANSSVLQNVGNSLAGLPNNNRLIIPLGTEIDSSTRQITGFAAGRILSANYASSTLTVTVEPHLLLSGTALIHAGMPLNPYIGKLYVAP